METNLRLECRDLGATSVVTPRDPEPMLKRGVGEAMRCGSDSAWTAAPADLANTFDVTLRSVPEGGLLSDFHHTTVVERPRGEAERR